MDHQENPYAPPLARIAPVDAVAYADEVCWREGYKIVVLRGQPLPPRCIKCNAPGTAKSRRFSWVTASAYLPLALVIFIPLLSPVFFLITLLLSLLMRKSSRHAVALCERHGRRRRRAIGLGLVMLCCALIMMFALPGYVPAALAVMGVGIAVAMIGSSTLIAVKIDGQYGYYRGCERAFLESLPQLPVARRR
jgi:MFS family permease